MKDRLLAAILRASFATVLMLGLFLPTSPALSMQEPGATTYEAELMEWEIQVTGPNYALQDVALEEYPHGRGERIYVSGMEKLAFAEIAFFDDADTPQQTIDVMLKEFESTSQTFTVIDQGDVDGISYALVKFQISDQYSGYFYIEVVPDIEGNTDVAQSLYTINEDFAGQLQLARDEIVIAGNAFLGVTVIDVEAAVATDMSTSTPDVQASPVQGRYTFQTVESDLVVEPPVTYDYPLQTPDLEAAYISSGVGFGFVGYQRQETDTPRGVIEAIVAEAPSGEEAPVLLELREDGEHATGVYRIAIDDGYTVMVIDVSMVAEGVWQIEALALEESGFIAELPVFQQAVMVNGSPFLDAISAEEIDEILVNNQP